MFPFPTLSQSGRVPLYGLQPALHVPGAEHTDSAQWPGKSVWLLEVEHRCECYGGLPLHVDRYGQSFLWILAT